MSSEVDVIHKIEVKCNDGLQLVTEEISMDKEVKSTTTGEHSKSTINVTIARAKAMVRHPCRPPPHPCRPPPHPCQLVVLSNTFFLTSSLKSSGSLVT